MEVGGGDASKGWHRWVWGGEPRTWSPSELQKLVKLDSRGEVKLQ